MAMYLVQLRALFQFHVFTPKKQPTLFGQILVITFIIVNNSLVKKKMRYDIIMSLESRYFYIYYYTKRLVSK